MKISLKLANGATLEFEGDSAEFERVSAFLAEPPDSLTAGGPPPSAPVIPDPDRNQSLPSSALEPTNVLGRLEQVGATNDQERVAVMAQLAVDAGKEGIDYPTLHLLYTELGLPKPSQFPTKTLANAKASGLMRMVKQGVWRPTLRGENFARGLGRGERQPRRSATRPRGSHNNQGGELD
jgi:hypothetical protein